MSIPSSAHAGPQISPLWPLLVRALIATTQSAPVSQLTGALLV
jgi:hypothetical protein